MVLGGVVVLINKDGTIQCFANDLRFREIIDNYHEVVVDFQLVEVEPFSHIEIVPQIPFGTQADYLLGFPKVTLARLPQVCAGHASDYASAGNSRLCRCGSAKNPYIWP